MLRRAFVTVVLFVLMPATVQAFDLDHHHSSHHSSGGDGCGSSSSSETPSASTPTRSSSSGSSGSPAPTPTTNHKRVFVTSTTYSGALGSVQAADAQCQYGAGVHGFSGVFRAWLSDKNTNAYDRVLDDGPWYTTKDDLAFSTKADLRGAPAADLWDEFGSTPLRAGAPGAWSGSDADGAWTGLDCEGWTSATVDAVGMTGSVRRLDTAWGGGDAPSRCDIKAPIICIAQ